MLTTPDHSDAVPTSPGFAPVGPTPQGFYLDCDAATGRAGTIYRAEEFNELILNLRQLLTNAAVTPTKGSATMLQSALGRLFQGNVTPVVANTTLTADNAGLVLIDATTGDLNVTLPKANVCPGGSPTFALVRTDASTHRVRIVPAAGDRILGGVIVLELEPILIRADGVQTWVLLSQFGPRIRRAVTLNVSPSGSATPVDPMGGDAFTTLRAALDWLNTRSIDQSAPVTIQIAAGTYVETQAIYHKHPNFGQISIQGAASTTTILQFNGCPGFMVGTGMPTLSAITLKGNNTGAASHGIYFAPGTLGAITQDVTVTNFGGAGLFLDIGALLQISQGLSVNACTGVGLNVGPAAVVNAFQANLGFGANLGLYNLVVGGSMGVSHLFIQGGPRGINVAGNAFLQVARIECYDVTTPGSAVVVDYGSTLTASVRGEVWKASTGAGAVAGYVWTAVRFSNINCENNLAAGSPTVPAVNTVGNVQSYIYSG